MQKGGNRRSGRITAYTEIDRSGEEMVKCKQDVGAVAANSTSPNNGQYARVTEDEGRLVNFPERDVWIIMLRSSANPRFGNAE